MISSNHVLSYLIIYFPEGVQARAAGRLQPGQVRSHSFGQGRTLQGCCQGEKAIWDMFYQTNAFSFAFAFAHELCILKKFDQPICRITL